MAQDKKSFVLYADLIHTVKKMPDDKAGLLLKKILEYVNDLNPEDGDMLVDIVFEPIKLQMKRDLERWEEIRAKRVLAGKSGGIASGEARGKQNEASASNGEANEAVTVNVTVTDNVIDSSNRNKKDISIRQKEFRESLYPFTKSDKNPDGLYSPAMMKSFYEYWSEPNKSGTKFKQETEKTWSLSGRLSRWASNNFDKKQTTVEDNSFYTPVNITIQHKDRPI